MMFRSSVRALGAVLAFALAASAAAATWAVGNRVEVDVNMSSGPGYANWKSGTITKVDLASRAYFVKLDGSYEAVIPMQDRWIRAGSVPSSGGSIASATAGAAPGRSPVPPPAPGARSENSGGGEFTSSNQCVVGARVTDRRNRTGTITAVDGTLCRRTLDDGTTATSLFWMLRPAGSSQQVKDVLVPGRYKCYSSAGGSTNYLFMDIRIEGPTSYRDNRGAAGRYRLEPSGRIVFESGPFGTATAKLLPGPKIGINMSGGTFFSTTCDLGH